MLSSITSLTEITGFLLEKDSNLVPEPPSYHPKAKISNSNNYYASMFVAKIRSNVLLSLNPQRPSQTPVQYHAEEEMANICAVKECPNVNPNAKYENAVALRWKGAGLEESKDTASEPCEG